MNRLKRTALILSVSLTALLCVGCSDEDIKHEMQAKICIDKGGIPILSIWDDRLADCIFKPSETQKPN